MHIMCIVTPKQKVLPTDQKFPAWEKTIGGPDRAQRKAGGQEVPGLSSGSWGEPWVVICLLHVRKTCPGRPVGQAGGFGHSASLNSRKTSGEHFQDLPVDSSLPSSPSAPRRALGWWAGDVWGCPSAHAGELGLQKPSPTLCPPLCVSLSPSY